MSNPKILIINTSSTEAHPLQGIFCKSFLCRLKGLMFQKSIAPDFGLLLAGDGESRLNAAIHMFFMNFDIAVIWLDHNYQVVDVQLAKKGHALYTPASPAQFTLETGAANLSCFHVGDYLQVSYVP